ncbi:hypothetical protein [Aggregatilinea lenta]|uniref:hypothetical protein n=1 Tax=Aggregatilinea lenta TaxID=913108 RepID=UPI000E5A5729|nr:hypothetical protein [Aggregatilinea lenta]
MANQAQYRFLPWTRRGLVAEVQDPDTGGALPGRAKISVGVTVTNVPGTNGIDMALYGPGDVLGIDTRLIVRASPRPGSTNVEPNYLPAIEFDPPDFPWMFSPAKAAGNQRLRPWLVLLVLDRANVKLPKADRLRPLPTITIPAEVAAQELPDLSESWAWAHTQVMTEDTLPASQLPGELANEPDLNVSRLVCPRRLVPNHQYFACLVPAFDAGVLRGMGGAPDPLQPLAPAWGPTPGEVQLPVYFHWEFATGPLGDFESLARKLKPFACPDTVGVIPMYIGDGNPLMPEIAPDQEAGNTLMDGALRAPARESGQLSDIVATIQQGLETALNLPSKQFEDGPQDATPILGPPIYGQWHVKQHTIAPTNPAWMHELNLDPRSRVAAGLGAEVVRKFQEDFMQKAWEQIGEVIRANTWLNWGRLSLEANLRLYTRHFRSLPTDRLLQMTGALHMRTLYTNATIRTAVRRSSLPNAVADPAMRRLVSPQRPVIKTVVRRLAAENRLSGSYKTTGRSALTQSLARGRVDVDPTRFMPDGLVQSVTFDQLELTPNAQVFDLGDIGLNVQIPAERVQSYRTQINAYSNVDFATQPPEITVRSDLRQTGLITRTHVSNITALELVTADQAVESANSYTMIDMVLQTAVKTPGAMGILITLNPERPPSFNPLEIHNDGTVVTHTSPGTSVVVGHIDTTLNTSGVGNVANVLNDLPIGTLNLNSEFRPRISRSVSGEVLLRDSAFSAEQTPRGVLFSPGGTHAVIPLKPGTLNTPLVSPITHTPIVTRPPAVTRPPGGVPPVVTRPPGGEPVIDIHERPPIVTRPPIDEGPVIDLDERPPIVTRPPIDEGPVIDLDERPPIVTRPPVDEGPIIGRPPIDTGEIPPIVVSPPAPTNTVPMPVVDVTAITQYEVVLHDVVKNSELNQPFDGGTLVPFDLTRVAQTLITRIDPAVMVPKRITEMVKVGGRRLDAVADLGVHVAPTLDRIMVAPEFPAAAYKYLALYDQERFVPGIGIIPPNSITLLETNPRFIEGFMVGLNYEMNREYLWRALPTDQRATSWRFFWDWIDRIPDIVPIHTWSHTTALGENARGAGEGGQLVLLVRGELVRRYPNAVLLAWKATPNGALLTDIPSGATQAQRDLIIKRPVFQGKLDPDIIFGGFDLVDDDLDEDGGWFFIVQEQPTEPRFGLDEPDGPPGTLTGWSGASWAHAGVSAGGHLKLAANPLAGRTFSGLTFGSNAAHMAAITLQQPMRVAVHGRYLVQ